MVLQIFKVKWGCALCNPNEGHIGWIGNPHRPTNTSQDIYE